MTQVAAAPVSMPEAVVIRRAGPLHHPPGPIRRPCAHMQIVVARKPMGTAGG